MRCLLCLRCVSVTLLTGFAVATVRYFSFWISNSLKIRELLKNVIQNRENVIQTDDYSLWGHRVFGSLWKPCQSKELLFPFDIGTQNFYQLLLSSEIGLFEVENMVRNWIFVGNLVQYGFPFVKHGVFCKVKSAISQFWTTFPTSNGAISELRRSWKKFRVPISKEKKQFFRLVRFPEWSEHSNPLN